MLQLRSEERQALAALPGSRFGTLFPNDQDLLRYAIKHWFRRARKLVAAEKRRYLAVVDRSPEALLSSIRRFLDDYDCELARLRADIVGLCAHCVEIRQQAELIRSDAVKKAESAKNELIRAFGEQVSKLHADLTNFISEWNSRIAQCRDVLQREAKPVGIDL